MRHGPPGNGAIDLALFGWRIADLRLAVGILLVGYLFNALL